MKPPEEKDMTPLNNYHRCATCDEWYDYGNSAAREIHQHPEPQSGPPRDAWMQSGLPYERWLLETAEGLNWKQKGTQ